MISVIVLIIGQSLVNPSTICRLGVTIREPLALATIQKIPLRLRGGVFLSTSRSCLFVQVTTLQGETFCEWRHISR